MRERVAGEPSFRLSALRSELPGSGRRVHTGHSSQSTGLQCPEPKDRLCLERGPGRAVPPRRSVFAEHTGEERRRCGSAVREGFAAHLQSVNKRRKAALGTKDRKEQIQERRGRLRRARVVPGFPKEQSILRCRYVTGERTPANHTVH